MDVVLLEEIAPAREKVLDNARQLVEEAELLFAHGRFARAYALAHLACEEMMKLPLLISAGCDIATGKTVPRETLGRLLTNHKRKLQALALFDGWFGSTNPGVLDTEQVADDLGLLDEFNNFKNYSLYVTMASDGFVSPQEIVTEVLAAPLVSLSRRRLRVIELLESGEGGTREAYMASPFHTAIAEELIGSSKRKGD